MAALDFPPSSESPFIAPNGVVYVWNDDGYWEADTSEVPSSDNTFLKLDASNDPITGNLTITGGLDVTTKVTAASTTDVDSDTTLVTKDYLNQTTADATFWSESGGRLYPKTLSNNVGIGTNTPTGTLSVNTGQSGFVHIKNAVGSTTSATIEAVRGSTDASSILAYEATTDDGNVFNVNYAGGGYFKSNVGIGTDSPSEKLEIVGDGLTRISVESTTNNQNVDVATYTSDGLQTVVGYSASKDSLNLDSRTSTGDIVFSRSGSERARLTAAGNLGIGTTAPLGKLDVQTANGERVTFTSGGPNQHPQINLLRDSGTDYTIDNAIGILRVIKNSDIAYQLNADQHRWYTPGVADMRMVIDEDGNVGIGSDSPQTTLQVTQKLDTSADGIRLTRVGNTAAYTQWIDTVARFNIGYSNPATSDPASSLVTLTQIGRLGIGTDEPKDKLHISTGSNEKLLLTNPDFVQTTTGASFDIGFGSATGNTYTDVRALANGRSTWGDLVLQRGGGRVGIGTASPGTKLNIADTSCIVTQTATGDNSAARYGITRYSFSDGGGAEVVAGRSTGKTASDVSLTFRCGGINSANNKMVISSNGNVGIGTDTPQTSLHLSSSDVSTTDFITLQGDRNGIDTEVGIAFRDRNTDDTNSDYAARIYTKRKGSAGSFDLNFSTRNLSILSTQMTIAYTGNVGIGTDTPQAKLDVDGNAVFTGTINGTTVGTSDQRFKENITPANPQLADVVALGGMLKNFDWNEDAPVNDELRAQRQLGLIAQEVDDVCPSLTKTIHRTKQGAELTPEQVIPAVYEEQVVPAVIDEEGNEVTPETTEQVLVTPEQIIPATYEELDDSYKGISQDALIMKLVGAVAELTARIEAAGI